MAVVPERAGGVEWDVLKWILLALFSVTLLGFDSQAVIIDSGDGTGNTTAPPDDPGFVYVGKRSSLSAIYVGYGWVLSAAHVGEGDVVLDGVTYPAISGSRIVLIHSGTTPADLELFRIDPAPPLAPLTLRAAEPPASSQVVMIGQGLNRGAAFSLFVPPSQDDGYFWGNGRTFRWGTNVVAANGIDLTLGGATTRSFYTTFTRNGPGDECQAANGDSGGAVFIKNGGSWELAGVMFVTATFLEQTGAFLDTAVYENLTYASDLSFYRSQILDIITPLCGNGYLTSDEQCDDGNLLDGDCCSSTCQFEGVGAGCEDGDTCTESDSCDGGGSCLSGSLLNCDDADACTADSCDQVLGCGHEPIQSPECTVAAVPGLPRWGLLGLVVPMLVSAGFLSGPNAREHSRGRIVP